MFQMFQMFQNLERSKICICLAGVALKWFESYIENRTQNFHVHDTVSEEHAVAFGVPQGSLPAH